MIARKINSPYGYALAATTAGWALLIFCLWLEARFFCS